MKTILSYCLLLALPFSLYADDEAFRSIVRGILAPTTPPAETTPAPKVVRQYPFNPEYPDVYLGDNGSEKESLFLEMVLYGQAQEGKSYLVVLSGRSSQGAFQKKMSFETLEAFLHFQEILENKEYDRIYFYAERVNEADYLLQKSPRATAPNL